MATTHRVAASVGTQLAMSGTAPIGIEPLAREAGIHPDIVRRLVRLGLIKPGGGTRPHPCFATRTPCYSRAPSVSDATWASTTRARCSRASYSRGSISSKRNWPLERHQCHRTR